MDRACQTTPTLLLGADDIVDKPRYTPTFLRDRSTSSEASIEEYSSTSATVVRSAQTPHYPAYRFRVAGISETGLRSFPPGRPRSLQAEA
mgnify:CR=1 FL=1